MTNTISPYPPNIRIRNISDGAYVFRDGKLLGEVQRHNNWGNDWRAMDAQSKPSLVWFATKTEAVNYLLEAFPAYEPDIFELNDWALVNHTDAFNASKYVSDESKRYAFLLALWNHNGSPVIS